VRVPAGAVILSLFGSALLGCRGVAAALGPGPEGAVQADALVSALAARFGPIAREPAFDALRPKLARSALVPSRVFDDPAVWPRRQGDERGVEFEGRLAGGVYRLGLRASAAAPREAGDYRGLLGLRRTAPGRFAWSVVEELAVGPARPEDLSAALTALFRAAEATTAAEAQAQAREDFPRSVAAFSRLVAVEELDLRRDADGATAVRLALRLRPDGIRAEAPRYASFLEKYGTPIRARARAEDVSGRAWWLVEVADNRWTLRLRVRGGSLVPLEGPATDRLPGELRVSVDYATRMGPFRIGLRGLVARVGLIRTPGEKALIAHFLEEPDWQLPFLVEPLMRGPLRHPFEGDGSALSYALEGQTSGPTLLVRRYRLAIRENWLVRWLGGQTNTAVSEFRGGAESEADRFSRLCLLALRDDLVELLTRFPTPAGPRPPSPPKPVGLALLTLFPHRR